MSLRRAYVFVGICLSVVLHAAQAPVGSSPSPAGQRPEFRATTTLVPIDVKVVDKQGHPVTDLTKDDFTLLENGKPQTIAQFSTTTLTPTSAFVTGTRPRRASDAFEIGGSDHRVFLIVFGRGWLQAPSKGVDAMIHLVKDVMMPQDYAAILAWDRATDFTNDRGRLLEVLERFKRVHGGIEHAINDWSASLAFMFGNGSFPSWIRKQIDDVFGGPKAGGVHTMDGASTGRKEFDARVARLAAGSPDLVDEYEGRDLEDLDDLLVSGAQRTYDIRSLYVGIEYMRHLSGQKHLIFVSEYGVVPFGDDDRTIGRRAADARVALDVIHAGGTTVGIGPLLAAQNAREWAKATGGQFFAHKYRYSAMDIDRIDEASTFQYTLGYYPVDEKMDGRFRRVEIKLNRKDLTVLARDGYFAKPSLGPVDMRTAVAYGRVAGAAEFAQPVKDLGITGITAVAAGARPVSARVAMTIDLSRVGFEHRAGRNIASLEVAVFAVRNHVKQAGYQWDTVQLTFTDERLAELRAAGGVRHEVTVPLTAAAEEVKVVVYDYANDLVGSAVAKITKQ